MAWGDLVLGASLLAAGLVCLVQSGPAATAVADFADDDPAGDGPTAQWFAWMAAAAITLLMAGGFLAQGLLP